MQIAYFVHCHDGKCFLYGHTYANKVYPYQTAPTDLSDQGILLSAMTQKVTLGYNVLTGVGRMPSAIQLYIVRILLLFMRVFQCT